MRYIIKRRDEDGDWYYVAHEHWSSEQRDAAVFLTSGYPAKVASRINTERTSDIVSGPAHVVALT